MSDVLEVDFRDVGILAGGFQGCMEKTVGILVAVGTVCLAGLQHFVEVRGINVA